MAQAHNRCTSIYNINMEQMRPLSLAPNTSRVLLSLVHQSHIPHALLTNGLVYNSTAITCTLEETILML